MTDTPGPEWETASAPVAYEAALAAMEERVQAIIEGRASEKIWLLEHPPLYTGGTGARAEDLRQPPFPVHAAGRGGQYTYHGPGQRVAYAMLHLKRRAAPGQPDVRDFVRRLENWLIGTLAQLGVVGFIRDGRVGVWVDTPRGEAKIAALGIRVRKWVSYHGVALNVNPDLTHYAGIVPCGITEYGVTSLAALGVRAGLPDVDAALKESFASAF